MNTRLLAAAAALVLVSPVVVTAGLTPTYTAQLLFPVNVTVDNDLGAVAAGQVAGATLDSSAMAYHAVVYNSQGVATALDANRGLRASFARATDGQYQVGEGFAVGSTYHALLWHGSASSLVDLNPTDLAGIDSSEALGIGGGNQVGSGTSGISLNTHALLWRSTAASAIDLNPANAPQSQAFGTDAVHQVGIAFNPNGLGGVHAFLWTGTAASAVDLNPAALLDSEAFGVGGAQQVGRGVLGPTGPQHAFLWSGTAASAIDLNPAGFTYSTALGTNGIQQVGYGDPVAGFSNSTEDALVWTGTSSSAVHLNNFLPFDSSTSKAYSIDSSGNIYGLATDAATGQQYAVEWSVPEPASLSVLILASASVVRRRRS